MGSDQSRAVLLDAAAMKAAIKGVAGAIRSEFLVPGASELALIGIQTHGVVLARRIAAELKERTGFEPPVGSLDISMYRDDIGMRKCLPTIHETVIPFDINRRAIILVDDVLQTGRTIRAALDALTDYGRPSKIRLAVLVDRDMREFPIRADYAGARLDVPASSKISVKLRESDEADAVYAVEFNTTPISGALP
jgi:pyrimidine operon attenuation protein/uracil phosphoribosyltransferase